MSRIFPSRSADPVPPWRQPPLFFAAISNPGIPLSPAPSFPFRRLPLLLQEIWFDTPITNYQGIGRGIQTCRLIFPQPDNSSLPRRHLELAARTMIERWLASLESGVEATITFSFFSFSFFLPLEILLNQEFGFIVRFGEKWGEVIDRRGIM